MGRSGHAGYRRDAEGSDDRARAPGTARALRKGTVPHRPGWVGPAGTLRAAHGPRTAAARARPRRRPLAGPCCWLVEGSGHEASRSPRRQPAGHAPSTAGVALQPATGSRGTPGTLAVSLAATHDRDLAVARPLPLAGRRLLDGVQRWPDTGDVALLVALGATLRRRPRGHRRPRPERTGGCPTSRAVRRLGPTDRGSSGRCGGGSARRAP